jgi:hypothetical protein
VRHVNRAALIKPKLRAAIDCVVAARSRVRAAARRRALHTVWPRRPRPHLNYSRGVRGWLVVVVSLAVALCACGSSSGASRRPDDSRLARAGLAQGRRSRIELEARIGGDSSRPKGTLHVTGDQLRVALFRPARRSARHSQRDLARPDIRQCRCRALCLHKSQAESLDHADNRHGWDPANSRSTLRKEPRG